MFIEERDEEAGAFGGASLLIIAAKHIQPRERKEDAGERIDRDLKPRDRDAAPVDPVGSVLAVVALLGVLYAVIDPRVRLS